MAQLRAASLSLAAAFAILGTATCAIAADSDAAPPVVAARRSATADALQHFFTGGVGGCVGAAAVFPIDLVKTRIQAQKGGKRRYASAAGCFSSVVREEGVLGLYSGLSAQLIGVWPEKVRKLGPEFCAPRRTVCGIICLYHRDAAVDAGHNLLA